MTAFPDDGDNADRILSLADTRMYHKKDALKETLRSELMPWSFTAMKHRSET
jgi:hypothetical protein